MEAQKSDRGSSRRRYADRRSISQRRISAGRRARSRRASTSTVETEQRSTSDRRNNSNRRLSAERRAGISRRFEERRRREGTIRILVVDGQETVRTGMCRVLTGAGLEAIEATEGHAGLSYYGETPADAIVVNLTLPDMDGVDFIRQVRDRSPQTKIVAIGGRQTYGTPDPLAMASRLDVRPLRWPFGPDGLLEAVNEVISTNN